MPSRARLFLSLAVVLPAAALPAQDSPAAHMPSDSFFYAELDPNALDAGIHQLDLVRLAEDPEFYDFLQPLFATLEADPARPVDSLLERVPVGEWLAGPAAVAIRGAHLWMQRPDGGETRIAVSPDDPLSARDLFDLGGLAAAHELDQRTLPPEELAARWDFDRLGCEFGIDGVAVLEPGPALRELVQAFLADPGDLAAAIHDIHDDDIDGRRVTHVSFEFERDGALASDLYADLNGPRWILATNLELFRAAVEPDPDDSLATDPAWLRVRERVAAGRTPFFVFSRDYGELSLLRGFLPPILAEAGDILGCGGTVGSGVALSLTEGGIRESIGVVLDGERRGLMRLLDAFPGGIDLAEAAPAGVAGLVSLKFDPALLHTRLLEVADEILPGTAASLRRLLADAAAEAGFDLEGRLLRAFGDEIAWVQFPPVGPVVPDWLLSIEVRDTAAARALVERLLADAVEHGAPIHTQPTEVEGAAAAWRIAIEEAPILPPTLALAEDRLVLAARADLAADALNRWGEDPGATVAASENWGRTLRGLTGGGADDVILLAYADLGAIAPPVLALTLGLIPPEFADAAAAPEPAAFGERLGGAAVALRSSPDGFSLDTFSPFGVLLPSFLALAASGEVHLPIEERPDEEEVVLAPWSEANTWNQEAWYSVRYAGAPAEQYARGLAAAKRAVELQPDNPWYLNTLGVALYRNGHYEEALATLTRSDELNHANGIGYDPAGDALFQAMCLWQLGRQEEARQRLAECEDLVGPDSDEETLTFWEEAKGLIQAD
ncbi:MAG: hypothetical protein D6702_01825 [Planctomycetota bacterium]|nr:MAG: hypothetical protein D6702_01825 [Planctomycetota bacterium]